MWNSKYNPSIKMSKHWLDSGNHYKFNATPSETWQEGAATTHQGQCLPHSNCNLCNPHNPQTWLTLYQLYNTLQTWEVN